MKSFFISLFLKLFGLNNVNVHIKSELSREEKEKQAMDYLLKEGMTYRVLPDNYEEFIGNLMTGVKCNPEIVMRNLTRRVLNRLKYDESQWHAIYAMVAPYIVTDQWPEQTVYQIRQETKEALTSTKNMLGYVKVLSEALMAKIPDLDKNIANAVACTIYYTEKARKEELDV